MGEWTPTCTKASADASALVGYLTAQPGFGVSEPSTVAGFAEAAAKAVAPLKDCSAVQVLAVRSDVEVGSDQKATSIVQQQISALLRTMPLSLTEGKVGQASFGTSLSEVRPVLVAVLGKPDKTYNWSCDATGDEWTNLEWGSLSIAFHARKSGKPLEGWLLRPADKHPNNLVSGTWPFAATVAQLQKIDPTVQQIDLFQMGTGPWLVEASSTMFHEWDGKRSGKNTVVFAAPFYTCE